PPLPPPRPPPKPPRPAAGSPPNSPAGGPPAASRPAPRAPRPATVSPAGGAVARPGSAAGTYFQICAPVTASTAYTPFGALKYMTLSTTIGETAKRPDPVWNVQARVRLVTLLVLICVSVEKRVPPGSPCGAGQSRPARLTLCP